MKRAFVSVITHGDRYLPGLEVVGKSLSAHGSHIPKILLATDDVSSAARTQLSDQGWQIRSVAHIDNPALDRVLFRRFAPVFVKLRAWQLVDFDRVVFLDADTLVMRNIDDLFERASFAAAPDFFMPDRFNSGVMLLEPSEQTFADMMDALAKLRSYDGGDQGFLNAYFENWYAMPVEHRLPVGYNVPHFIYQFLRAHSSLREAMEREVRILHYMVQKPWQTAATLTGGSSAWWKAYFGVHPEAERRWKIGAHALEDWTFDHLSSLIVR